MTGPINFSDITVGMQVTATTTWNATGASSATSATVLAVDANGVTLSTGDTVPAPVWVDPATTVTYNLDSAAPTPPPPEPALGTVYADETGAAWQATGSREAVLLSGIDGTVLTWAGFLAAHPTYTLMQDSPTTPLPDPPPAGYPVTIGPGDARLGMDVRVTVTYDTGGSRVVRGVCPWVQQNPPPDDATPSFLCLPAIGGEQLIANQGILDLVAATPSLRDQIVGRFVVAYDPPPAGITVLVEQMQAWTADSVWDISGIPEPPVGGVIRSKNGIAWQRTGNATADDPNGWYTTGQGMWTSVTGEYPRSFLWLWGAAAPFNLQEATP